MKKRFLAYVCTLALLVGVMIPFSAAVEDEAVKAADALTLLELTQSAFQGEPAVKEAATRAQAVVLLVNMTGSQEAAAADPWISGLQDIGGWAHSAITYAHHQGWASGVRPGYFLPDGGLSANAWYAFLLRALGYSDKDGDFAVADAVLFARHIGLAQRDYEGYLTQGQLLISAKEALTFSYRDGSGTMIQRLVERKPALRTAANALGLLDVTLTARQAADRLMPAVFCLDLYEKEKEIEKNRPSSNSSGFFISADGLAVTNYHSIEDAIYGLATLATGEVYEVEKVIYYDAGIDIAVLRISRTSAEKKTTSAFQYLEMVGTEGARPGDPVYTLGNPLGLGLAVSSGIISAMDRQVSTYDLPCVMSTADISKGSSGGALLNVCGQVIAVTSGAYAQGNSMYLGVPVNPVMEADLTAEGWTLAEVTKIEQAKAEALRAEQEKK